MAGEDLAAQIAQRQAQIGGGKPGGVCGVLRDTDVFSSMSLRAVSLDKPICQLNNSFQNRKANGSSMSSAMADALAQFARASEAGKQWWRDASATLGSIDIAQFADAATRGFNRG